MKDMVRKCVVKVVLSKEQREILVELSSRLGTSESEAMSDGSNGLRQRSESYEGNSA